MQNLELRVDVMLWYLKNGFIYLQNCCSRETYQTLQAGKTGLSDVRRVEVIKLISRIVHDSQ